MNYTDKFLFEKEEKWRGFEKAAGKKMADALREWYELYTEDVVDWFAELYEPRVGGWYYSKSARDNETVEYREKTYKLLPDVESTNQALNFLQSAGLVDDFGGRYSAALPEWMKKDIVNFVYNLQDEDGFYYHPQWGKEIPVTRRGRDLSWSRSILRNMGVDPKYASIVDKTSDEKKAPAIPEHLASEESFRKYLEPLDLAGQSYGIGSLFISQAEQIKAAGRMGQLIKYLNERQRSDTGYWHATPGYTAVNGLLKISSVYNVAEVPFPNAMAAARSAIEAISSPEEFLIVCDIYNTWFTVDNIASNLRKYGGEEGERQAKKLISDLRDVAAEGMRCSARKLKRFKKADGSFSYLRDYSSEISQSMPVALYHTVEGDVNATLIATSGTVEKCLCAIGMPEYMPPIFGRPHFERFMEIIEENRRKAGN